MRPPCRPPSQALPDRQWGMEPVGAPCALVSAPVKLPPLPSFSEDEMSDSGDVA